MCLPYINISIEFDEEDCPKPSISTSPYTRHRRSVARPVTVHQYPSSRTSTTGSTSVPVPRAPNPPKQVYSVHHHYPQSPRERSAESTYCSGGLQDDDLSQPMRLLKRKTMVDEAIERGRWNNRGSSAERVRGERVFYREGRWRWEPGWSYVVRRPRVSFDDDD